MAIINASKSHGYDQESLPSHISTNLDDYQAGVYLNGDTWSVKPYGAVTDTQPVVETKLDTISASRGDSFFVNYYNRIHLYTTPINAGAVLANKEFNYYVWNAHCDDRTLSSVTESGTDGISDNVSAPQTFNGREENQYTLTVTTNGPAEISATWTFNFSDANDPVLTVTGTRTIIWPFIPMTGVKEQLSWLTDVIETYDTEQRVQLLANPRQGVTYRSMLQAQDNIKMMSLTAQWADRMFSVPLWWDYQSAGSLTASDTSLSVDTTTGEFVVGGSVFIWDSNSVYEGGTIDSLTSSSITLAQGLENSYDNAKVMPMRSGYLATGIKQRRITDTINQTEAFFRLRDSQEVSTYSGTTYAGYDVLEDETVSVEALQASLMIPSHDVDGKTGDFKQYRKRNVLKIGDTFNWITNTRAARWSLREFLHKRKGMGVPFWLPSWRKDFNLQSNIGSSTTSLDIDPVGADKFENRHVMIRAVDGTKYYRQIIAATSGAVTDTITIDSNLGTAYTIAEIDRVCLMDFVRLSTDSVDLKHEAPEGNITRVSVPITTIENPS